MVNFGKGLGIALLGFLSMAITAMLFLTSFALAQMLGNFFGWFMAVLFLVSLAITVAGPVLFWVRPSQRWIRGLRRKG